MIVLETDTGPVLVRLDYHNLRAGCQYVARTVELDPTGADLPDGEVCLAAAHGRLRRAGTSAEWWWCPGRVAASDAGRVVNLASPFVV
jgi:hypothetical protein